MKRIVTAIALALASCASAPVAAQGMEVQLCQAGARLAQSVYEDKHGMSFQEYLDFFGYDHTTPHYIITPIRYAYNASWWSSGDKVYSSFMEMCFTTGMMLK